MDNNRFDIQIVTTTVKKYNIYIFVVLLILLIINFWIISIAFNYLVLLWTIIAILALIYEYKHSKSLLLLATTLLFNDDGFSVIIEDEHFNLKLKKEDVASIQFNKKTNHIYVYQKENLLCDFIVTEKSLNELYDIFNSFGYNCEFTSIN